MVEGGKDKAKNPMRDLRIRKLCMNICVGESGDRLTRAGKVRFGKMLLLFSKTCIPVQPLVNGNI